ncbi:hypothetical protein LCGC14_1199040, partial [marine sediment metagenome]
MADCLPGQVLTRQDKFDFAPRLAAGIVRFHGDLLDEIAADRTGRLGAVLDMAALRDGIDRMRRNPAAFPGREAMMIWRVAGLHLLPGVAPGGRAAAA